MPSLTRNSVALVTAGSARLGDATACALASSGVRVVFNYLPGREKADQLIQDLSWLAPILKSKNDSEGAADQLPHFISIQADASGRAKLSYLVGESAAAMGRLDVVVSNQGWTICSSFMP
jgi:NAD(P)-dependent dehydrogenase (short-subunit alcohol dehydrogenase family)